MLFDEYNQRMFENMRERAERAEKKLAEAEAKISRMEEAARHFASDTEDYNDCVDERDRYKKALEILSMNNIWEVSEIASKALKGDK